MWGEGVSDRTNARVETAIRSAEWGILKGRTQMAESRNV